MLFRSIKFLDAMNASVRPFMTYLLLCLYISVKYTIGYALYNAGADGLTIARTLYTPDDQALFWGIANFWFLDRVIKARSR